uniref:Uncharacterized protein n=1 Tax=Rhipicephalus appendiculatus TaxID=34631 RepID=A0A131YBR3_RHIAP
MLTATFTLFINLFIHLWIPLLGHFLYPTNADDFASQVRSMQPKTGKIVVRLEYHHSACGRVRSIDYSSKSLNNILHVRI